MKKSLIALAFGTLGLGIAEFVMMGILPDVAKDLGISIPMAGHFISAYALGVCVGAPVLTLARKYPLKHILLVLVTLIMIGNICAATAPNYWILLAARFISGLPHGAYFGVGSIVAERLADKGKGSEAVSIMIAGMTITDERKANYDFSDPYFQSGIQLAVAKDNKDIKSYKDLKDKTVGAKVGTESADFLEAHKKEYGYNVKSFDAADQLYDALKVGSIDAMMDDYPVIGYAVNQGQNLKTPIKREIGGEYGFAVKKGQNAELREMFTEALKEMKRTGEYDEIVNKYIGTEKEEKKDAVDESTITGLLKNNYKSLLDGLWKTIVLALVSFALALVLGVIFGLFRVSPVRGLRTFAGIYIDIIRGIPMMVLAFFIFFGLPGITGIKIPDFAAGIITLTLNASAYIAEIVRGGINAVPVGQMEASRSLGLSYNRTMQKIILPQAVKIMIPSFINQFVISLKDTTIISAIGVVELLQTGKIIVARTTQSSYVYLIIAIMYLILITILTKLANRLEKKVK